MSKIATEILRTEKPTVHELRTKVKETEAAVWYNRKEYGKMANVKKKTAKKFCKPCNSKSHDEASCWGPCGICDCCNHQTSFCKFKDNQANTQIKRADKATAKDKKKKTGKRDTVNNW